MLPVRKMFNYYSTNQVIRFQMINTTWKFPLSIPRTCCCSSLMRCFNDVTCCTLAPPVVTLELTLLLTTGCGLGKAYPDLALRLYSGNNIRCGDMAETCIMWWYGWNPHHVVIWLKTASCGDMAENCIMWWYGWKLHHVVIWLKPASCGDMAENCIMWWYGWNLHHVVIWLKTASCGDMAENCIMWWYGWKLHHVVIWLKPASCGDMAENCIMWWYGWKLHHVVIWLKNASCGNMAEKCITENLFKVFHSPTDSPNETTEIWWSDTLGRNL